MSKGSPTISLRLPACEREALEQIAARQCKSLSDVTRAAVALYLERDTPPTDRPVPAAAVQAHRKLRRTPSRPARLAHLVAEIQTLLDEYTAWHDRLPEFAQESSMAELLNAVIDGLETASDALAGIAPPRGFGRD